MYKRLREDRAGNWRKPVLTFTEGEGPLGSSYFFSGGGGPPGPLVPLAQGRAHALPSEPREAASGPGAEWS